ncbi:hypothetical protein T12_7769 [Trichinella patagoniensis]|uniref:Uncharacterized protein n=1 Tax=Trichinella patagoniensis TaxID=990121 RepID=A0A0V0YXU7_9BILA|nr:hypothetical protein T12_7769 [Trichinella patagoniensis]
MEVDTSVMIILGMSWNTSTIAQREVAFVREATIINR